MRKYFLHINNKLFAKIIFAIIVLLMGTELYAQSKVEPETAKFIRVRDSVTTIIVFDSSYLKINTDTSQAFHVPRSYYLPMIIVDGEPSPFVLIAGLDSSKIKATLVLRGASSGAIYGPEAAWGAIIITTSYTKREWEKLHDKYKPNPNTIIVRQ